MSQKYPILKKFSGKEKKIQNLFFSKFFEIDFGIEEKYFYCSIVLLSHGQRPKNLYLRNLKKNQFFFEIL